MTSARGLNEHPPMICGPLLLRSKFVNGIGAVSKANLSILQNNQTQ